ncbi:MAG: hypothetical protein P9X24_00725 [Candidatus Hatepunaea meridiana]|nr:hypothetical protein [Candidatus Hatepunaea meridiana]
MLKEIKRVACEILDWIFNDWKEIKRIGYAFSSAGVAQLAARSQADTHAPQCKNAASFTTSGIVKWTRSKLRYSGVIRFIHC